ncbi:MAG: peptidoglycan DD-metalloendopeptidase family protein [Gammaproteobacteria bacterium]
MIWRCLLHVVPIVFLAFLVACGSSSVRAPVGEMSRASSRPASGYHVVRRGESLYSIAWQYGLNARDLASWNDISAPFTIYQDQRIRLHVPKKIHHVARPSGRVVTNSGSVKQRQQPSQPVKKAIKAAPKVVVMAKSHKEKGRKEKDGRTPSFLSGKIPWQWPVRGRFKTSSQSSSAKKGIRIYGKLGEPVRAAAGGKVVYAGSGLPGYGNLIIIKHNSMYLSAYAHNRKLIVKENQWIDGGEKVALMGHSGVNRTQLYFEIRKNSLPVDPLKYLPKRHR